MQNWVKACRKAKRSRSRHAATKTASGILNPAVKWRGSGHFHCPLPRPSVILFAHPLYMPGTVTARGKSCLWSLHVPLAGCSVGFPASNMLTNLEANV